MKDVCEPAPRKESGSLLRLLVFSLVFYFLITPAISTVTDCVFAVLRALLSRHLLAPRINQPCAEALAGSKEASVRGSVNYHRCGCLL